MTELRLVEKRQIGRHFDDFGAGCKDVARASEAQEPLGIDYIVGDGRDLRVAADYDLAVAAYFLNYAHDRAELNAMCSGIARCLKPGGRFVTVNNNPAWDFPAAPSYRKYGLGVSVVGPFREGAPIIWTFYLEDCRFGFREIRWHQPMLSPEGASAYGRDYWSDLLDHPPIIFIECWLASL
jgi:SAM-dependent methyltransferase